MQNGIASQRLDHQRITRPGRGGAEDVVAWLGAVQAQEYPAAKWGLALRMSGSQTDADIERACTEGRILRTHLLRPTWHFVTPADIRWMLDLTAPRVHQAMGSYNRKLGLDSAVLTRAAAVFERALEGGHYLTRAELGERLTRAGLAATGVPLALMTMYAELEGIICSGPRREQQLTYALLAERAPEARRLPRDEALSELTRRYFGSHGPATIRDFVWWSGLMTSDAKRGLQINKARQEEIDGRCYWTLAGGRRRVTPVSAGTLHLLPIYDEYLVAYRDRDAVPHTTSRIFAGPRGTVTFQHALVISGQIAGTWKTVKSKDGVIVDVIALRRLTRSERSALEETAARYGEFLGMSASLSFA